MFTSRFIFLSILMLLTSTAFAISDEAAKACEGINPPGVWQDCVKRYDEKLERLKQDPPWQAQQRREAEEKRRYDEQKQLKERELELLRESVIR